MKGTLCVIVYYKIFYIDCKVITSFDSTIPVRDIIASLLLNCAMLQPAHNASSA